LGKCPVIKETAAAGCSYPDAPCPVVMRKILLFLFFMLSVALTRAQERDSLPEKRPEFNLSLNLAGDASILSVGIEKLFFINPGLTLAGKLGFGFNHEFQLFDPDPPNRYFVLSDQFSVNFGKKRSFLELGLGTAFVTGNNTFHFLAYPLAGYRFHPFKNPGLSFRIWTYYPFGWEVPLEWDDVILVPFGASVGIAY
jgi:hypothetical protein